MAGIEELLELTETNRPKIVDGNKIRVYRGHEKMPLSKRHIFNKTINKGKYFTENLADAKWYAQRQKTLKGKVTYLDLVKEQFDKAKKVSQSSGTRLGGEVIVDSDLLKKQKTDILRTIAARAGNLSNLALKGLSVVASLPAQVVVMTLSPTDANADEVNMQLEDFAKLADEAQPKEEKKEMMAAGGNVPSTDIKDYWRRSWGIGDRVGLKAGGGNIGGGIIEGTNLGDRTGFAEIDIGDRKTRSPHQGVTKIGKPVTVSENVKKYTYLDKATNKKITIFKALILDRPTEIGGKMTAGIEGDYKNALLKDEFHTLEKAQDAVTNYRKKNPKKVIVKDPDAPKKSKDLKKQKIIAAKGAPLWLTGDPKIHKGHATTVANPDITIKPGNIFATPEKINVALAPKKIKNVKEIKTPYTDLDFKIAELETQAKEMKNSNLPDSEKIPKLNAIDEKLTGYAFDSKGYKTVRLSDGTLFNSGQASTQSYDMADIFPSDWSEAKTKKFVSNYLTEEGKLKSKWHVNKDGFLKNDPSTKLSNIDRANIEKSHIFLENVKNAKANAKKILPKVEKEFKKFGLTLNKDQVNKARTFLRSALNKGQNVFKFMPNKYVRKGGGVALAVLDYSLFHHLFEVPQIEALIAAGGWLTKNDVLGKQIIATAGTVGMQEDQPKNLSELVGLPGPYKEDDEVGTERLTEMAEVMKVPERKASGGLSGVDQYIINRGI